MPTRIEDYALIGNCATAALVGLDGSIDWLCLPRFDSPACFAALLGREDQGRWQIAPAAKPKRVSRQYRDRTLILETKFETEDGAVLVIDAMSRRNGATDLLRRVKGLRGQVKMHMDLVVRFDYGSAVPWVSRTKDGRVQFVVGPHRLMLQSGVRISNRDMRTRASFTVSKGEEVDFALGRSLSYHPPSPPLDVGEVLGRIEADWLDWTAAFKGAGKWSDIVLRSLITLKALTHHETGGIVAAPTTSLPEQIGGARNWDYRYCWLRDATLTLYAFLESGLVEEAEAWRQWLLRAVAGSPDQVQIMYGVSGERRLDEWVVPWLPGYDGSVPVRIGNAAKDQVQLDIYGEVLGALYFARKRGLRSDRTMWDLECALVEHLAKIWDQPDDGIWEVRGGRQHFTHSKVMAWVAVDRALRSAEEFGHKAPLKEWRKLRQRIHDDVCAKAFDEKRNSFVQSYGSKNLDANLLLIGLVGFLPADDPRVKGTVAAIEKGLLRDGFVIRYDTESGIDGLPVGEGAFLPCSFWLADNYILQGRIKKAERLFERLAGLCNDVGLLSEEYDPRSGRQVGNFPQAFSHLALINTAYNLIMAKTPEGMPGGVLPGRAGGKAEP